jgi:nitrite reductase/ring-hydroxylating ferredoxin subunit
LSRQNGTARKKIAVDFVLDLQPKILKLVANLSNVDGKYYAIGNVYTHEGGPLDDGILEGYEVECPWHGSKFDIRNGKVARPPAQRQEPTYEVKVEDGGILIRKQQKDKPDQR